MIVSRTSALLGAALAGCVVLTAARAHAQWWSGWSARAPADFEECADAAEKAATKEARTKAFSECHSKFAGRRKPGGGYTYFDFMQNRHFDIAGPNPTPAEQKQIDEQYTAYLDRQRRSIIAAAFTAKQQQLQQASYQKPEIQIQKTPLPREHPNKIQAAPAPSDLKSRTKAASCAKDAFSCEWPRLSDSIENLKKALFGSSASTTKAKRS